MGVSRVLKPHKEPGHWQKYSEPRMEVEIAQYSVLFKPQGLLETLFGKINLSEKNIPNMEGLKVFHLEKRRQYGVGKLQRYRISCHGGDKIKSSSSLTEASQGL